MGGQTRENSITVDTLRSYGITAESWAKDIESGRIRGYIALSGAHMVGYCFGDLKTGEILVLAVLPSHECQGIGQRLLALIVEVLKYCGYIRLFLGCSSDPKVREKCVSMVVDRCRSKFGFVRVAADAAPSSRWTCVCRLRWGLHRCFSLVAVVGRWRIA